MITRHLRGNHIQNNGYTGLPGTLSIDTEDNNLRLHNGEKTGGFQLGNKLSLVGPGTFYIGVESQVTIVNYDPSLNYDIQGVNLNIIVNGSVLNITPLTLNSEIHFLVEGSRYRFKLNVEGKILDGVYTQLSSEPPGRRHHASCFHKGNLYIYGGATNDFWKYNVSLGTWAQLNASVVPQRDNTTITTIDDKLYVFGGKGATTLNDLWEYDPSIDQWREIITAASPSARYYHSAMNIDGKLVVYGGYYNLSSGDRLVSFDPSTEKWQTLPDIDGPPTIYRDSADSSGNEIYVFGGQGTSGGYYNTFWKYNVQTNIWTELDASMLLRRLAHKTVHLNGFIYVIDGYNGSSNIDDLWVYSLFNNTWTQLPSGAGPKREFSLAAGVDCLFMFGGSASDNTLWRIE